ncbi:MAG: 1-acyl-sn-glycerol-3-phosphate acyltransferase [Chthonomonas sp.]|nr:1-acyl-sn-glycerol-3-phosphate acyltransferase [Chthonomonas sp.]
MAQEQGLVGRLVGGMVRRSVRARFHTVYWSPPTTAPRHPAILYANHHGWMDGYLMFYLIQKLNLECVDWIQEFDSFPLFAKIGGMRYPLGDTAARAATIKRTIRLMQAGGKSLVIFPEMELQRPGPLRTFGEALSLVARKVPDVQLVPVAIRYEMSIHERPEAWLTVGEPEPWCDLDHAQQALADLTRQERQFQVLIEGTKDVNERFGSRK